MLNKLHTYKKLCAQKSQKGVVLFFALIALVAMSLAAAALIRSVDSGVLVAGNLAFKQSAILSAESGLARAYSYMNANVATLDTKNSGGYYNVFSDTKVLTASSTWSAANSISVPVDGNDFSGNTTQYILERMCRSAGPPDFANHPENCLRATGNAAPNSKGGLSEGGGAGSGGFGAPSGSSGAVVYRATVRVTGPKNTVSYLQAFIY